MIIAPLLVALSLAAPGDTLIRANIGKTVPSKDDKVGPVLSCPFTTPGDYATGITSLCTPATAITVTRSSSATYENPPGTLVTATADRLRVAADGAMIEASATNSALRSSDIYIAPWYLESYGTYTFAADACPDRAGVMALDAFTRTGGGSTSYYQRVYNGFPTLLTSEAVSLTLSALSSTATGSVEVNLSGVNVTGCTCRRSDGGTCTASVAVADTCSVTATVGTTPVRLFVAVAATAGFSQAFVRLYAADAPGVCYGEAQAENGSTISTSYIPTTTTAATRQADVVSAANAGIAALTTLCVESSVKWYAPTDTWIVNLYDVGSNVFESPQIGSAGKVKAFNILSPVGHDFTTAHIVRAEATATDTATWGVRIFTDGTLETSSTSSLAARTSVGKVEFGSYAGSFSLNGYLKNVKLYNVPCSKAR